jgi:hypothetical protein
VVDRASDDGTTDDGRSTAAVSASVDCSDHLSYLEKVVVEESKTLLGMLRLQQASRAEKMQANRDAPELGAMQKMREDYLTRLETSSSSSAPHPTGVAHAQRPV